MKTELPSLPKQNQHKEADFGVTFRHWFKDKQFESCSFELKDTRGKDSFNLSELKEAQRNHGQANKSDKGNLIRVSVGTTGTADYLYLRNAYAYIVINYPKSFVVCDIDDICNIKGKSLTYEQAQIISII